MDRRRRQKCIDLFKIIVYYNVVRLGFLVDFLSHAALVGFMAGAAIVIGLQQLKGLFGLSHFTNQTDVVSVLSSVFHSLHHPVRTGFSFLIFFFVKI